MPTDDHKFGTKEIFYPPDFETKEAPKVRKPFWEVAKNNPEQIIPGLGILGGAVVIGFAIRNFRRRTFKDVPMYLIFTRLATQGTIAAALGLTVAIQVGQKIYKDHFAKDAVTVDGKKT